MSEALDHAPGFPPHAPAGGRPAHWELRVLGGLRLSRGPQVITRLPSRAITALLLRLALQPQRAHAREELIELLWPGVELAVGRNRLRQALSALKTVLEGDNAAPAAVLQADRVSLRLLPGQLDCDVPQFEQAVQRGAFTQARQWYAGDLLPGYYDEWIVEERRRLEALFERCRDHPVPAEPAAAPHPTPAAARPAPPGLPTYLTRYFDDNQRAAQLRDRLREHRLVSLIGPGGVGKTRLSVELAHSLRAGGALAPFERVMFVAMERCHTAGELVETLSLSLGLAAPRPDKALSLAAVLDLLTGGPSLLVLDNLEQAIEPAAGIVLQLLEGAPQLRIVTTSRHPLGVDGEQELALQPLSVSEDAQEASPAVALFVDRARSVRADFHLSRDNRAAVLELVSALQGLPLALEIAAVRVRAFSPAQMLAQWQQPQGGEALAWLSRHAPRTPRHASMQAVVGWSWTLLNDTQRELLGALTVLGHHFTEADALALVDAPALETLAELVGHSLVYLMPADAGASRYAMLAVIRRHVRSLVTPGQERHWRGRLRAALVRWAQALGTHPRLEQFTPRLPSVQAMLASAGADDDAEQGLHLALALWPYWEADGVPATLLEALEALLGHPALAQAAPVLRWAGHDLLAMLCFTSGRRHQALQHAQAAVDLAGTEPGLRAAALVRRAWVLLAGERSEQGQEALLEEAITLAREAGDTAVEARAWHQRASIAAAQSRFDAAERCYAHSQVLWEALGRTRQAQARRRNRAQCLTDLGQVELAVEWIKASQEIARADADWVGQMDAAYSLASAHERLRDWDAALASAQLAVQIASQRQHLHGLGLTLLLRLGRPLARLHRPEAAARLTAYGASFWRRHMGELSSVDRRHLRLVRALVRAQVGAARCAQLWAEGEALSRAAAVALALTPDSRPPRQQDR